MEPKVLYENSELLVIDKPAGMVVNRAESVRGETVQDWVETYFTSEESKPTSEVSSDFKSRSGVVHRIDKETSGVLVIAKTPEAFGELQRQFKEREVEKKYVALVHGRVEPAEGVITANVGRLPWNRERFGVLPGGREAETKYKVLSIKNQVLRGKREELSLLELHPKTGRTHQIRVHLKSINHPILGDEFYAGRKTARADRRWSPRLFLHASEILFTDPLSGQKINVKSELPQDLGQALATLEKSA